MGTIDLPTVTAALETLVEYVGSLEQRVQTLQVTTAAIAGEHLRDEDVVQDVIRAGDTLRVATSLLEAWIDNAGGATAAVFVKEIRVEDDGTKTIIVGPKKSGP